ncbi:hypothetical protein P5673_028539 [Acropora cervicornis]|uniref:Uncharacterized protein n=1 Tax=Acropora cervicornis TaxID=6130 RepID=A0AAD9PX56_ACRCE|nr:hypothetical protein P5673_028539 [Acropora cervicornis]
MPDLPVQLESSHTTDTRDTSVTTSTASLASTSSSVCNALTASNALPQSTSHSTSNTGGRSTTSAMTTQSELGYYSSYVTLLNDNPFPNLSDEDEEYQQDIMLELELSTRDSSPAQDLEEILQELFVTGGSRPPP